MISYFTNFWNTLKLMQNRHVYIINLLAILSPPKSFIFNIKCFKHKQKYLSDFKKLFVLPLTLINVKCIEVSRAKKRTKNETSTWHSGSLSKKAPCKVGFSIYHFERLKPKTNLYLAISLLLHRLYNSHNLFLHVKLSYNNTKLLR